MSVIDTLITDRTQSDVDRVAVLNAKWEVLPDGGIQWTGTTEELAEWTAGLKGSYNLEDLNRVGLAIAYLADEILALGYDFTVTTKTNWTTSTIPTVTLMDQYLDRVSAIRAALPVFSDTPEVPESAAYLTYQKANDIEKILQAVNIVIENIKAAWFYSGEIYCGEV